MNRMTRLLIENHGPLITATNFWDLPDVGELYCSTNAGAIRILLPRSLAAYVGEWRSSEYAILSRGLWPEMGLDDAVEIMFEDHTDSPFALHLANESFDLLPAEPEPGREWIVSAWCVKHGRPHKALERACRWRRVESIPCLQPWRY